MHYTQDLHGGQQTHSTSLAKETDMIHYSDLLLKECALEKQLFSGEISINTYLKKKKTLKNISQS
jgi:hypothetical protein